MSIGSNIQIYEPIEPYVNFKKTDGPMLVCSTGNIHYLTLMECLMFKAGILSIEHLDKKYNTEPRRP